MGFFHEINPLLGTPYMEPPKISMTLRFQPAADPPKKTWPTSGSVVTRIPISDSQPGPRSQGPRSWSGGMPGEFQPSEPNRSELHLLSTLVFIFCLCVWIQVYDYPHQWAGSQWVPCLAELGHGCLSYTPKVAKVILFFVVEKSRKKQELSSIFFFEDHYLVVHPT